MPDVSKHRGGGVSRIVRADGTVVFRARARVDGKTISLGIYESEDDARAVVRSGIGQLGADLMLPGASTLGEWGAEWLERRERGGLVRGVAQERSVWRTHIAPAPIAQMPLRSITRPMIVRWLDALIHETTALHPVRGAEARPTSEPLSRQTVQHALRVLRSCLRAAQDAGRLDESPAHDVRVPQYQRAAEEDAQPWTWLTLNEIARLLESPTVTRPRQGIREWSVVRTHDVEVPEDLRLAWTVLIYTGIRPPGELLRLRWRDVIDLDGEHPRIRVLGKGRRRPTREVPLLPPAAAALRRWREIEPGIGTAPVFRRPAKWGIGWRRWAVALIGRHARLYDTRHTCASHLVQGSWGRALSLYEVAQWLGHTSITTTTRYAHLRPDGLRGAAVELSLTWAPKKEGKDTRCD
jgi:integrase